MNMHKYYAQRGALAGLFSFQLRPGAQGRGE